MLCRTLAILAATLLLTHCGGGGSGADLSQAPAPHAVHAGTALHIDYVVVPHPDDEIEGWSLIERDANVYPVFVLLTHGEETSFCNPSSYRLGYQPQLSELPAVPVPQGVGTQSCSDARLHSYAGFLDDLADATSRLGHLDTSDQTGTGTASPNGCKLRSTSYLYRVGPSSARITFDLGDGRLQPCGVVWAVASVRALVGSVLPNLAEQDVIGAGYYYAGSDRRCISYRNSTHEAIYTAVRTMKLGLSGSQYQRSCEYDGATVSSSIDPATFDAVMKAGSGLLERNYGWLTVDTIRETYCCYDFQYENPQWFYVARSS